MGISGECKVSFVSYQVLKMPAEAIPTVSAAELSEGRSRAGQWQKSRGRLNPLRQLLALHGIAALGHPCPASPWFLWQEIISLF